MVLWQDYAFLVGGFAFALLLVPTLRDPDASVPRSTSIPTATILMIYAGIFLTLGLTLSAVANVATGMAWFGIAIWRS